MGPPAGTGFGQAAVSPAGPAANGPLRLPPWPEAPPPFPGATPRLLGAGHPPMALWTQGHEGHGAQGMQGVVGAPAGRRRSLGGDPSPSPAGARRANSLQGGAVANSSASSRYSSSYTCYGKLPLAQKLEILGHLEPVCFNAIYLSSASHLAVTAVLYAATGRPQTGPHSPGRRESLSRSLAGVGPSSPSPGQAPAPQAADVREGAPPGDLPDGVPAQGLPLARALGGRGPRPAERKPAWQA